MEYGDDELFTKYVLWPRMKKTGSIITHKIKRGTSFYLSNPYNGSCEESTRAYCQRTLDKMRNPPKNRCRDYYLPQGVDYPQFKIAYDKPLSEIIPYLKVDFENVRIKKAMEAYTNEEVRFSPKAEKLARCYSPYRHQHESIINQSKDWLLNLGETKIKQFSPF